MFRLRLHVVPVIAALVALMLGALSASAAPAASTTSGIFRFPDHSMVAGGSSTLTRTDTGVTMRFTTPELAPGSSATIWWVVFNNPTACSAPGCSEDDLFNPDGSLNLDQIAAADISVLYAAGHVIGATGNGNFAGHLSEGTLEPDGAVVVFGNGLKDARTAEIHLVLRTHGAMIPSMVAEQISTFNGGCTPGGVAPDLVGDACQDLQFAVHQP